MFGIDNHSITDKTSALSETAFQLIVTHAFGACNINTRRTDDMGIDASCIFMWEEESECQCSEIHVQLKSTNRNLKTAVYKGRECWVYSVKAEQLNKYRAKSNVPLYIVLVLFPTDEEYEEWLKIERDASVLKSRIYWVRIEDAGDAKSRVYVPVENRLTQDALLRQIIFPLAGRD